MPRTFVIRPFNVKKDSAGNVLDFERVHNELIGPAIEACGFSGETTGDIVEPGNIREDMFALIIEADLVICDITIHNANVFYELGIRHALRKKRTVMLKGSPTADATPFDILTDRYVAYKLEDPAKTKDELVEVLRASLASERPTDSPIFKMLPDLPETDPATIQVVPLGFRDEVSRASAAAAVGWLRLLAEEVRGMRFERPGLQLIADCLLALKDYAGARDCLEQIRVTAPGDDVANLALANVYERLSRRKETASLLANSDLAIERVLHSQTADAPSRVEALALKGRNRKTRWRAEFEPIVDLRARRSAAMNEALRQSYDAYYTAFQEDLNHFWSGLAALQMGVTFLDLAGGDDWMQSFDSDKDAVDYRERVASQVAALRTVVSASVEAALRRMPAADRNRIWATVSKADLLFLTEDSEQRLVKRYRDAITPEHSFAWDSARGQLALFAELGVRAGPATAIMAAIDERVTVPRADAKPLHLVLFTGHQIDAPTRPEPRFPAAIERAAVEAIERALAEFGKDHTVVGLASAAPGGDILFHEVCARHDVPSTICLPMPRNAYVEKVFTELKWRDRFQRVTQAEKGQLKAGIMELSDTPGLPSWLHAAHTDPWERGNRWVLQMALTAGASKVTLLTIWDGRDAGDARGGTAHMVALARKHADVAIHHIDTRELLGGARV